VEELLVEEVEEEQVFMNLRRLLREQEGLVAADLAVLVQIMELQELRILVVEEVVWVILVLGQPPLVMEGLVLLRFFIQMLLRFQILVED
jgi:hypothetical protein